MRRLFFTLFFAFSLSVQASDADILAGIFPGAQAYPYSEIISQRSLLSADYLLGLGPLQKIHGVWRHKKSVRLEGDLHRFTYQISGGRDVQSAIEYLQKTISPQAVEMYSCESRGCGSSAQWASLIFKQRQLYGLDSHQRYLVYRFPSAGKVYFLAAYGVKRANGRQYLHIEVIETEVAKERLQYSSIANSLDNGKVFQVRDIAVDQTFDDSQLQTVIEALNSIEGTVALVCHRYGKESAEFLLNSAQRWCERIRDQIVNAGIDSSRVMALGVGSLQPNAGRADRLELVAP